MSGRRSKALRAAARALVAQSAGASPATAAATLDAGFSGGWGTNGHQAADFSRLQGYGYFPELDTRKEITTYTRTEVLRRVRLLLANNGFPRRIIYGLARLAAGTGLTPHALTTDREWNKAAEAFFAQSVESPFIFDIGKRYDFYSAQPFVLSAHYRDGDQATVLTESLAGRARFAFYEGHQVANPPDLSSDAAKYWRDGVRTDRNNAAISYGFLGDENAFSEIPSESVLFMAEYERAGQSRCTSILEHAVKKMFNSSQILSYIQTGVKLTNLFGYWFEYEPNTPGGSGTAGGRIGGPTQKVTTSTGETVTLEKIFGGGAIPDLPPGAKLKTNNSSHPHPNNLGLLDYLNRDIAWGAGVSPDLLWNIAMLGGANTRFILADAQSWIDKEQAKLIRCFCQRVWLYTIAKGMKTGALRRCTDPEWWKVGWIPPPRLTVDYGRDGKLYITQNQSCMLTLKTAYGWQGLDWQEQVTQWLDEIAYIKAGLNAANARARKDDDRNLTWEDIQMYRNNVGNSRIADTNLGTVADDGMPTDPSNASAALAELAKDPARAQALLAQLAGRSDLLAA